MTRLPSVGPPVPVARTMCAIAWQAAMTDGGMHTIRAEAPTTLFNLQAWSGIEHMNGRSLRVMATCGPPDNSRPQGMVIATGTTAIAMTETAMAGMIATAGI